jgi:hypothetical protein
MHSMRSLRGFRAGVAPVIQRAPESLELQQVVDPESHADEQFTLRIGQPHELSRREPDDGQAGLLSCGHGRVVSMRSTVARDLKSYWVIEFKHAEIS